MRHFSSISKGTHLRNERGRPMVVRPSPDSPFPGDPIDEDADHLVDGLCGEQ